MKRFFAAAAAGCILLSGVLPMCACKQKETEEPFDYAALYTNERTQPYEETDRLTSRSRYGYTCAHEQGFQGWSYLYGKGGSFAEMTWNAASKCWEGGGASMQGERLSPAGETAAVRLYNSPRAGEAVLYGNYKCADASDGGAHIEILLDGEPVYEGELSAGDIIGRYCELSVVLREGSEVAFVVSGDGDVLFDPAVTLEEAQNASLYHLTASGKQYGDVFPYYDEEQHRLYMGFLWSDNAALADNYHDALEISGNMLTFTDVPEANNYDTWQYYRENYRLHQLFDVSRFCDRSIYSYGVRDNMLYFDEENERYLMVAGCYYAFDASAQTSDLVIYCSDDKMGLSWTRPGNVVEADVVEAGYSRNLPECPSLMKIGDRWYVFVSVAYNTVHQVGPLQYWTGDAGVDCMDVDWSEKEFAFLDGEDLCAARPTQVGDKVYLWLGLDPFDIRQDALGAVGGLPQPSARGRRAGGRLSWRQARPSALRPSQLREHLPLGGRELYGGSGLCRLPGGDFVCILRARPPRNVPPHLYDFPHGSAGERACGRLYDAGREAVRSRRRARRGQGVSEGALARRCLAQGEQLDRAPRRHGRLRREDRLRRRVHRVLRQRYLRPYGAYCHDGPFA